MAAPTTHSNITTLILGAFIFKDMTSESDSSILGTTATSLEILELLEDMDGARVNEIAEEMDRPKSTVHGHLKTLERKLFVTKDNGIYYPGPELLRLGHYIKTSQAEYVLAEEFTDRLYEQLGYRSIFVTEMGGWAVFLHIAAGERSEWSHEGPGERLYLHNTAVGKAILGSKPNWRVEEILDQRGMPAETENTTTSREALLDELEEVRQQGYAVNHEENIEGLSAVGVAAEESSGNAFGAFSVSGPTQVFDENIIRTVADEIMGVVKEFELELTLG